MLLSSFRSKNLRKYKDNLGTNNTYQEEVRELREKTMDNLRKNSQTYEQLGNSRITCLEIHFKRALLLTYFVLSNKKRICQIDHPEQGKPAGGPSKQAADRNHATGEVRPAFRTARHGEHRGVVPAGRTRWRRHPEPASDSQEHCSGQETHDQDDDDAHELFGHKGASSTGFIRWISKNARCARC